MHEALGCAECILGFDAELDEKTVKQSNFPRNRAVIVSVHLKR